MSYADCHNKKFSLVKLVFGGHMDTVGKEVYMNRVFEVRLEDQ